VPTQLEQAANCRQKIDQARATIDREAAKLTKLLAKIRADCPHLNLIEISMFDLRYYRQTRRMCIDCGIIEVSDFMGHYRILKGEIEFTCKSSKVFEKHCPFGCCEIWTVNARSTSAENSVLLAGAEAVGGIAMAYRAEAEADGPSVTPATAQE
jgi:hypothetical protein